MKPLFEVHAVDRKFYEKRLRHWLPDKIIDIHTHVWLKRFNEKIRSGAPRGKPRGIPGRARAGFAEFSEAPTLLRQGFGGFSSPSSPWQATGYSAKENKPERTVSWPVKAADENSGEHLVETYSLMFPGKTVTPLMFTSLVSEKNLDKANDYVAQVARERKFPALIFSHPRWSGRELTNKIRSGGFYGAKSYLSLAPACLPASEIRIFDFFPHHQLEALNHHGWIMMLHIPRQGRLRDPVNLAQMLEIEERYPDIKLIIAHVGRAYCPEDIGDAFKILSKTRRMCFDISANTNAEAFRQLLETVGPKRVLFGSDLPILRMRTRRICEKGFYVNLVPKGLYGDVSGDKHLREVDGAEAERLTFFMYEELDAFRRAAHAVGLTADDIKDVFYNNAQRILKK